MLAVNGYGCGCGGGAAAVGQPPSLPSALNRFPFAAYVELLACVGGLACLSYVCAFVGFLI